LENITAFHLRKISTGMRFDRQADSPVDGMKMRRCLQARFINSTSDRLAENLALVTFSKDRSERRSIRCEYQLRLIDIATGAHIWADRCDPELINVFRGST